MVYNNVVLVTAIIAWFIAQVLKLIINFIRYKTIAFSLMVSSGGMPSSHSAIVISLATKVGRIEGFDSSYFAIASVLALIVMYDALNVRRQAGRHAEILNILTKDTDNSTKLKELLGHKPIEVFFGALLGVIVGYMVN